VALVMLMSKQLHEPQAVESRQTFHPRNLGSDAPATALHLLRCAFSNAMTAQQPIVKMIAWLAVVVRVMVLLV
jgi:hypothetical protein